MIGKISEMASAVAAEGAEFREAIEGERESKRELLHLILREVRPALKECTGKLTMAARGSVGAQAPLTSEFLPFAALIVSDAAGPKKIGLKFTGKVLVLDGDGVFHRLVYGGGESAGAWAWRAEHSVISVEEVVEEKWDVAAIVEYVSDALAQQLDGKKAQRTNEIRNRAAQIKAVATLLKGIS